MRFRVLALVGAVFLAMLAPTPAVAAGDSYAADPHGLVPFIDTVQQVYTTGTDVWDVWICDVSPWDNPVDLTSTVANLNAELNSYFGWLSNGAYTTTFQAGGTVVSSDNITRQQIDTLDAPYAPDCEAQVSAASTASPNGALIIVDIPFPEAYATVGAICPEDPFTGCMTTYPDNARRIVLGAATVLTMTPWTEPFWNTVAHEIGHTLTWTHSYGGLTIDPDTSAVSQYDNVMDVMSGGVHTGSPVGTIAYNRYAAGWIDPADVAVHTDGDATYDLAAIGSNGIGMLVIPTSDAGRFFAIDARRKTSFDSKLITAGVEIYEIDQRREIACLIPDSWPQTWPCFATLIRIKQTPAVSGMTGTAHVLNIDEDLNVGAFNIKVLAAGASSFSVQVNALDSGTFIDDDDDPHEANIEAIAAAGITNGCNPPDNNMFCPDKEVTRAEMAAFIVRAMGLEDQLFPYQGTYPDVPDGEWYTPYVEMLAAADVTNGYEDGTYRPDAIVTRAEMSVFLTRAFSAEPNPPAQGIFVDVPPSEWYAGEAEWIYGRAITQGCLTDPLSYCPDDIVKRDQMASFLARALGIGT